jgi:hypothetical protein
MGGMKNHLIKVLEALFSKLEARRAGVSVSAHDSVRGDTNGRKCPRSVAALPRDESNSAVWSDAATLRWWRRRFAVCLSQGLLVSSLAAGGELNLAMIGAWEGVVGDLALVGRYACVTAGEGGLALIDVSDPTHPRSAGAYQSNNFHAGNVRTRGTHAFVSAGEKGLWAFEIAATGAPTRVGTYEGIQAGDFVISSQHAYVCGGGEGFHVIDVSDPTNVVRLVTVTNLPTFAVAVAGNHAFVRSHCDGTDCVVALDVSDPANPIRRAAVKFPGSHRQINDLACVGDYLYVTGGGYSFWGGYYYDGLVVFDISNPADLRRVAGFDLISTGYTGRILSLAHYVLVGFYGGFVVMDVTTPANPREVGRCSTTFNAEPMAVRGAQVFGRDNTGLVIFELLPFLNSITKEGPNVKLEWEGFGSARLQRATRLANPDWQDLPGFEGANTATLTARVGAEFFRLVRP